jgi:hypothetical protein
MIKGLLEVILYVGDPDWIQTNDLLLRRQLLYSAELPGRLRARREQKGERKRAVNRQRAAKIKKIP